MIFTILLVLSIIFSFISIIIALSCLKRFDGKLKNALISLIIALFILFARGLLRLLGLISTSNLENVNLLMNFALTLFILITTINLKQVIQVVDGKKR